MPGHGIGQFDFASWTLRIKVEGGNMVKHGGVDLEEEREKGEIPRKRTGEGVDLEGGGQR